MAAHKTWHRLTAKPVNLKSSGLFREVPCKQIYFRVKARMTPSIDSGYIHPYRLPHTPKNSSAGKRTNKPTPSVKIKDSVTWSPGSAKRNASLRLQFCCRAGDKVSRTAKVGEWKVDLPLTWRAAPAASSGTCCSALLSLLSLIPVGGGSLGC